MVSRKIATDSAVAAATAAAGVRHRGEQEKKDGEERSAALIRSSRTIMIGAGLLLEAVARAAGIAISTAQAKPTPPAAEAQQQQQQQQQQTQAPSSTKRSKQAKEAKQTKRNTRRGRFRGGGGWAGSASGGGGGDGGGGAAAAAAAAAAARVAYTATPAAAAVTFPGARAAGSFFLPHCLFWLGVLIFEVGAGDGSGTGSGVGGGDGQAAGMAAAAAAACRLARDSIGAGQRFYSRGTFDYDYRDRMVTTMGALRQRQEQARSSTGGGT